MLKMGDLKREQTNKFETHMKIIVELFEKHVIYS